jgi:hypothetical protein
MVPLATTAGLAIVGWFAVHLFATSRDRRNKRRDLRLQMLIDAYRGLAGSGNRPLTNETSRDVEKAIDAIQLIGTPTDVALDQRLAKEFADTHHVDWQPLLVHMRQVIRAELKLEPVEEGLVHFRHIAPTSGMAPSGGAAGGPTRG